MDLDEGEKALQAENTKILHRLQSLLIQVSGLYVSDMNVLGLGTKVPSALYQIFICGTVVLSQLRQF